MTTEKKTGHTPGECDMCQEVGRPSQFEINGVRFACDNQHSFEAHIDDFPVYAAAPELLAACKDAIGFCVAFRQDVPDWPRFPEVGRLFAIMTAVIAKVEEGQQDV